MVKKEKDDFLAAQGFAAANCLIRVILAGMHTSMANLLFLLLKIFFEMPNR